MNLWPGVYRAALWLLPSALRQRHGDAMTEMFAAEVESVDGIRAMTGVAVRGILDVVGRAAYEMVRPLGVAPNLLPGDAAMTSMSAMTVARRMFIPFMAVLLVTTDLLVANFAFRRPQTASIVELVMLALPFTAAMTIPISMFIAMFWVSRQMRMESPTPSLSWPVVRPVLVMSALVSVFAFALGAEVVPRANARLASVMAGHDVPRGDRSMTLSELREASHSAQAAKASATALEARDADERVANLDVEFHKKFAISAAVLVLALVGLALGWQFPRAGVLGTGIATIAVIGTYYVMLMAGESLADHRFVSPSLAMWAANLLAMALAGATTLTRRRSIISS